jgi:undecaprenyl diphosphate synthase
MQFLKNKKMRWMAKFIARLLKFPLFNRSSSAKSFAFSLPAHVAIIMDGNGRWARRRGLPRVAGHRAGAEALRRSVKACAELGIKYLTVYAFSTENWRRPKEEVGFLMQLLSQAIDGEIDELDRRNVRVRFLGRIEELSQELQDKIARAMEKTTKNSGLNLSIMLNYGGRAEILDAVNGLLKQKKGGVVTEEEISNALYTHALPDPDLLIRTASEMRVSNFLLWQIAYAELYVTKTLWPDFGKQHLIDAVKEYGRRVRKFGKTEEQVAGEL